MDSNKIGIGVMVNNQTGNVNKEIKTKGADKSDLATLLICLEEIKQEIIEESREMDTWRIEE